MQTNSPAVTSTRGVTRWQLKHRCRPTPTSPRAKGHGRGRSRRTIGLRADVGGTPALPENREPRRELPCRAVGGLAGLAVLVTTGVAIQPAALANGGIDYAESPSRMTLKLKPRIQAVIQESKADHNNDDLSNQDLSGANFAEADLRRAKLEGCDLRGAVFSRSVMYEASLAGSDATNALFDYVVLRGASLRGVIAEGANFVRSDLGEVDVTNADFTDALIDRYQVASLCETASGTNPATGVDTRESLGCERVKRYSGFNAGNKVPVVDAAKAKCLGGGCRG